MDGSGGGGAKCGRWIPTSEQVKVLTDLFRSGLRTPTADQIQKISLQLSFYGKIESKNVFYWFQNHKARERQRRRKIPAVDRQKSRHNVENSNSSAPTTRAEVKQMDERKYGSSEAAEEEEKVMETEKVTETLQLFPLRSPPEGSCSRDESKKLRLVGSECKETTPFSYAMESGAYGPPLDLRLSFCVQD